MGIPWSEGPYPNTKMLNDRWRFFKSLHEKAKRAAQNNMEDTNELDSIMDKMNLAYDTLSHNMAHINQQRAKNKVKTPPSENWKFLFDMLSTPNSHNTS